MDLAVRDGMIKFLSLYLGLLTGVQPVEVVVGNEVTSVELWLDGEQVGVLESEPWRLKVDFGPKLLPRRLVALAFDDAGREIGRTEQLINLPRAKAEAGIVLERDGEGVVTTARVSWQSVTRDQPIEVLATFDGVELPVGDPKRIAIPRHDSAEFHLLVVDLRFSDRDEVQAVASFGGAYLADVATELTALPARALKARFPDLSELQGTVLKDGQPLRVVTVDKSPAEILIVRDSAAAPFIQEMGTRGATGLGGTYVSSATGVSEGVSSVTSGPVATPAEQLRRMLTLDSEDRIRMIWPATRRVEREEVRMDLFPASPVTTASDGGVYWALTQKIVLDGTTDVQRLVDAVAVAGVESVARSSRRAVVLVLGSEPEEASKYDPANVREYLRVLGVPLYVWAVGPEKASLRFPEWGEVEAITSLRDLQRAVRRLEKDLERQRILWVDGRHLPQEIELRGRITGL